MLPIGARRGDRPRIAGLLDIGTAKTACLIVEVAGGQMHDEPSGGVLRVLGIGHTRSRGVKAGVVTDLDAAGESVRAAVGQAERVAGVTLESVYLAVSCGRIGSLNFTARADVASGVVGEDDIARLVEGGRAYAERGERSLLHMNRLRFRLDGNDGVRDPRGMAARAIAAEMHAVTVDEAPLRNLLLLIERCYLGASGLVAGPYASALGATTADERRLGVTCIDIGAGTIGIAAFAEGRFLYCDAIASGGNALTYDIARQLQAPLSEAERIKALYGTVVSAPSDSLDEFSYPLAGEVASEMRRISKAALASILRPRVAGILGLVRERLERGGVAGYCGERIVLTGGTSQLVGFGEFAASALGRPTRVARPEAGIALPGPVASPAFSCAAGLGLCASGGGDLSAPRGGTAQLAGRGYLGQVGAWLRQGF